VILHVEPCIQILREGEYWCLGFGKNDVYFLALWHNIFPYQSTYPKVNSNNKRQVNL
jgi:hypothetical protein